MGKKKRGYKRGFKKLGGKKKFSTSSFSGGMGCLLILLARNPLFWKTFRIPGGDEKDGKKKGLSMQVPGTPRPGA